MTLHLAVTSNHVIGKTFQQPISVLVDDIVRFNDIRVLIYWPWERNFDVEADKK